MFATKIKRFTDFLDLYVEGQKGRCRPFFYKGFEFICNDAEFDLARIKMDELDLLYGSTYELRHVCRYLKGFFIFKNPQLRRLFARRVLQSAWVPSDVELFTFKARNFMCYLMKMSILLRLGHYGIVSNFCTRVLLQRKLNSVDGLFIKYSAKIYMHDKANAQISN